MYRAWIGLLAFCVVFTVVGLMDIATTPSYAAAQDAFSSLETVDEFYKWYLEYSTPDADGNFSNPLSDGAYRDSVLLTPNMIANVDALQDDEFGFGADPFLCAQALPQQITVGQIVEDADTAQVLVGELFGLSWHFITAELVTSDSGWQIDAIVCGETVTPGGVVETFYRDYVAAAQYDEAEQTRHNPLQEGLYRDSAWLTNELIADLDSKVASGELRADPLLCAQDVPQSVYGITVREGDAAAVAILREYFQGNAEPRDVQVHLAHNGAHWQIAAVTCDLAPETVIEMIYSHYARQIRLAFDSQMPVNLLDNPMRPWNLYLSPDVLADLQAAREDSGADPVLCAQDIPEGFEVSVQEDGSYLVTGLFPSGPVTMTAYPLAEIRGADQLNGWDITSITCVTR